MKDFLKTIGLLKAFTINLDCPKSYFIKSLEEHVDTSGFQIFEKWSKGPAFKGNVSNDTFSIRKRKRPFNPRGAFPVKLNGIVTQRDEKAVITVETDIRSGLILPLITVFVFIVMLFVTKLSNTNTNLEFFLLIFLGQILIITTVLYFNVRGAVSRAQLDTEKEFVWMVKNYRGTTGYERY